VDTASFEKQLRTEGFTAFTQETLAPSVRKPEHEAGCDVAVLVTAGRMTLKTPEGVRSYGPGESFRMPKGCRHAESTEEAGCAFFIARRPVR